MSAAEDRADVEDVLAGDTSAFEGIVRRWQSLLVNLAYRFCRDRGRSEEMAQEAFLRAYRSLSQWRAEAAFSTWLFALATNLYRSELRRLPANTVPVDEMPDHTKRYAAGTGQAVEDRDQTIHNAVLALPRKYREAVTLFYFHEMDISAAASSLGLPDGTVKAKLFRGRELLRAKLQHLWTKPRQKALP